jgi:exodeoxyribonuclease VII large subunit
MLGRSGCDVIAVVRGGGARADLAAFDTELVARAVAEAGTPVWTGIGHTGDETVADVVANRVCVTPTECGQAIVARVGQWWMDQVADPAQRLARRVPSFLSNAESRDVQARRRLTATARHQLRFHQGRLGSHATSVRRAALGRIESRESGLRAHTARLGPLSLGLLGQQDERLRSWRRLLAAYDVDRQLERGYSLTLTADGALIRSSGELEPAQEIVTRFADGTVRSRVEASEMRQEDGRGHSG